MKESKVLLLYDVEYQHQLRDIEVKGVELVIGQSGVEGEGEKVGSQAVPSGTAGVGGGSEEAVPVQPTPIAVPTLPC